MSEPTKVLPGDAVLRMLLKLEVWWLSLITVFMAPEGRDRYREERHSHLLEHLQDDRDRGRSPLKSALGISLRFLVGMPADLAACARQSHLLPGGCWRTKLSKAAVLYALAMPSAVVSADLVFFRDRLWERLTANVVIIVVLATIYVKFLKPLIGWRGRA